VALRRNELDGGEHDVGAIRALGRCRRRILIGLGSRQEPLLELELLLVLLLDDAPPLHWPKRVHVFPSSHTTHSAPSIPQAMFDEVVHVDALQQPVHVTGHSPPQPSPPPHGLELQLGVQTHV
jgi:hypothetical protein